MAPIQRVRRDKNIQELAKNSKETHLKLMALMDELLKDIRANREFPDKIDIR